MCGECAEGGAVGGGCEGGDVDGGAEGGEEGEDVAGADCEGGW